MTYNDINFNQKTILITGGAGFIGSNFIIKLLQKENDFEIITMDRDFDKVKHIIKVKEQRDRQIEVDIGGERG